MTSTPKIFSIAAVAAVSLAAFPAFAQELALQPAAYSSSASGLNPFAGEDIDGRSLASAPDGTIRTIAPQYGGGYGGGRYHPSSDNGTWSHLAFEAGGGFTAPIGNAASGGFTSVIGTGQRFPAITWGGNFLVGAGWNFTKRFALLGEFQWDSNKIPGRTLSALYLQLDPAAGLSANGIYSIGGNVHTLSLTAEPVFYYYNSSKHSYAGYLIGGGGWYHKSTNFTAPVQSFDPYYGGTYVTNQTFDSVSDNALGANIGTGISFKPFGEYSKAKLFAEARYVFVNTPSETATTNPNTFHTGTEELIPVTFGIRF